MYPWRMATIKIYYVIKYLISLMKNTLKILFKVILEPSKEQFGLKSDVGTGETLFCIIILI